MSWLAPLGWEEACEQMTADDVRWFCRVALDEDLYSDLLCKNWNKLQSMYEDTDDVLRMCAIDAISRRATPVGKLPRDLRRDVRLAREALRKGKAELLRRCGGVGGFKKMVVSRAVFAARAQPC